MFNNVDWASGRVTIPKDRICEYTADCIREEFFQNRVLQLNLLNRLISFPCLFCEEGVMDQSAYVGQINRMQDTRSGLSLEVSFDQEVPPLPNSTIYEKRMELDMPNDFEFSRNHWAVKDVDLYRFLYRNVRPRRQRPIVFNILEHEKIEANLVSVMMPFAAEFNAVYASIRQSASNAGLQCLRADDIWENPSIIQDVVALIDRSRIVVCDCTGRNPNVFYEAGIAHTLGREVILITQSEQDIPFDLRHLRHVRYLNNTEGHANLTETLQCRMQTILGQ